MSTRVPKGMYVLLQLMTTLSGDR